MKYNTFIFDFDFTLADATKGIVESANYALDILRLPQKSTDKIRRTVGMTLKEAFSALTGETDDEAASDFVKYFKVKSQEVMTDSTILFPDTVATLEKLKKRGWKTAIVTNKDNYRIVEVLEKYGFRDLIDYIVGFEDVKEPKPSPEGVFKVIDALMSDKEKALYVGDSLIDANTAKNARVDFAAVTTGTTLFSEFNGLPYITIGKNLTELYNTLEHQERIGHFNEA